MIPVDPLQMIGWLIFVFLFGWGIGFGMGYLQENTRLRSQLRDSRNELKRRISS